MIAAGLIELSSIAYGIRAGDAMVKQAPIASLHAGTVHPGKYLLLAAGDVASVEEAMAAALAFDDAVLDRLFLPQIDPQVVKAIGGQRATHRHGEALGIVELTTVAATVAAADRGVKGADVMLRALHLADGLGGKAYVLFEGVIAEVEAAVQLAVDGIEHPEQRIADLVIPQLHDEMRANLDAGRQFMSRVGGL